jgi:hypothetical protein
VKRRQVEEFSKSQRQTILLMFSAQIQYYGSELTAPFGKPLTTNTDRVLLKADTNL